LSSGEKRAFALGAITGAAAVWIMRVLRWGFMVVWALFGALYLGFQFGLCGDPKLLPWVLAVACFSVCFVLAAP
jgi:hypothetical protein